MSTEHGTKQLAGRDRCSYDTDGRGGSALRRPERTSAMLDAYIIDAIRQERVEDRARIWLEVPLDSGVPPSEAPEVEPDSHVVIIPIRDPDDVQEDEAA